MTPAGVLQCGHGVSAVENPAWSQPRPLFWQTLQCGHGVSAVENSLWQLFTQLRYASLQCGHGVSAVENLTKTLLPNNILTPFNAATAFRPWRTRYYG